MSTQAEAAFLGCLLQIHVEHVARGYLKQVEPDDFTDPRHAVVCQAMQRLAAAAVPVDPVTVLAELRRSGDAHTIDPSPQVIDGRDVGVFLAELMEAPPTCGSVGYYLDVILEDRLRREIAALGCRMQQASDSSSLEGLRSWLSDGIGSLRRHLSRLDSRELVAHE